MNIKNSITLKPLLIALSTSAILLTSTATLAENGHHSKGGNAGAHHHHHDSGHDLKRMAKFLKLSDEQRQQMRDIFASAKAAREENKEAHRASRAQFNLEMKALMDETEFNENAFINLYQQNQDTVIKTEVAKAKVKHAMLQVLTEEQKVKWIKFKKKTKKHAKRT